MTEPTPRPWRALPNVNDAPCVWATPGVSSEPVARCETMANAQLIVDCVNGQPALVARVRELEAVIERLRKWRASNGRSDPLTLFETIDKVIAVGGVVEPPAGGG